ncbi:MAG TPA: glycosyltransferase family 4 protein [Opitutaceae bacterium]|nr:glycosyltransferase family 4 protein [Opitutaceae bacterium]
MPAEPPNPPPSPGTRPPPVFLITHEFHPHHGGIATFTEEIARAAAELGHDLEVWAPAVPTTATPEQPWPFRLRRLPLKGTHDWSSVLRLMFELVVHRRRLRYATVYLPEPGPIRAMMWLQFIPGFRPRRLVLTFHGSEIIQFHNSPVLRRLARRLIRHAGRISVLTGYTHRLLCERFPEAAGKTFLTPGAPRASFSSAPFGPVREPGEKVIILTVGRLHPRKGQLFIIEALQSLPAADRARVEYWLVGGNSKENYEERLRGAAAASGLAVQFRGHVPDDELIHLYHRADIFAMTSIDHRHSVEGFGLVYLEAAAHGLPVVAHAVGGVPEAVVDGVTGLLVPPGDRAALTAAFARLIADPGLRARLGRAGRDWARQNSWVRSAALLFNDVEWTITG